MVKVQWMRACWAFRLRSQVATSRVILVLHLPDLRRPGYGPDQGDHGRPGGGGDELDEPGEAVQGCVEADGLEQVRGGATGDDERPGKPERRGEWGGASSADGAGEGERGGKVSQSDEQAEETCCKPSQGGQAPQLDSAGRPAESKSQK